MIFELLENNERDLAQEILRTCEPLSYFKVEQPDRFLKLNHLCQRPYFKAIDVYEGST